MINWKRLAVGCCLVIMSGCSKPVIQDIVMVGDCEHGLVSNINFADVRNIFPEAQQTDVLIAGGCYQQYIIKQKVAQ